MNNRIKVFAFLITTQLIIAGCSNDTGAVQDKDEEIAAPVEKVEKVEQEPVTVDAAAQEEESNEVVDEEEDTQQKTAQNGLPNIMDEAMLWEWDYFKDQWGAAQEIELASGTGYHFESIPEVAFVPNDEGLIAAVEIYNGDVDIYGSHVGQTPSEVKQVMDDYGFLLVSEGEDVMNGGWLLQYQIDSNKMAWYSAASESEPVYSILVNVLEAEETEAEEMVAQDPIRVTGQITGVSLDLIGRLAVEVLVTNFEDQTVSTGRVNIGVEYVIGTRYDFPLTMNESFEFNNVQSGESRTFTVYVMGADINGLKSIDATGTTE